MDKNMLAGIWLILCPGIAYLIEKLTSKRDGRFKLGYNPKSMSWKGWVFTIIWLILWFSISYLIWK